jgi:hypothetical protein
MEAATRWVWTNVAATLRRTCPGDQKHHLQLGQVGPVAREVEWRLSQPFEFISAYNAILKQRDRSLTVNIHPHEYHERRDSTLIRQTMNQDTCAG